MRGALRLRIGHAAHDLVALNLQHPTRFGLSAERPLIH